MRNFHARSETYRAAQASVTDAHTRHLYSQRWGDGTTVSSDRQFFRASDRAVKRSDINLHHGSEPGTKFYSGLSNQYSYFSILPISPTESEAVYVLDGLFDHKTILKIEELFSAWVVAGSAKLSTREMSAVRVDDDQPGGLEDGGACARKRVGKKRSGEKSFELIAKFLLKFATSVLNSLRFQTLFRANLRHP